MERLLSIFFLIIVCCCGRESQKTLITTKNKNRKSNNNSQIDYSLLWLWILFLSSTIIAMRHLHIHITLASYTYSHFLFFPLYLFISLQSDGGTKSNNNNNFVIIWVYCCFIWALFTMRTPPTQNWYFKRHDSSRREEYFPNEMRVFSQVKCWVLLLNEHVMNAFPRTSGLVQTTTSTASQTKRSRATTIKPKIYNFFIKCFDGVSKSQDLC